MLAYVVRPLIIAGFLLIFVLFGCFFLIKTYNSSIIFNNLAKMTIKFDKFFVIIFVLTAKMSFFNKIF